MKLRIIQIMSHPPAYHLYPDKDPPISWVNKAGRILGIWGNEWGDIIGNRLISETKDNILFEVWQPDYRADRVYTHIYESGLVHRLFPAKKIFTKITLFGGKKELFCEDMITYLNDYRNEMTLIHSFFNPRYNIRFLLRHLHNHMPFLFQFATNTEFNPYYGVHAKRNLKNIVQNIVLFSFYTQVKYLFTNSNETLRNDIKNTKIFKHIGLSNIGIDIEMLNCEDTKLEARDKLLIPQNLKVLFASQRIIPEKQIDKLIQVISKLKSTNIRLYISGSGDKVYVDNLKKLVRQNNVSDKIVFTSFLSEKDLKLYYRAADVFISTSISEAGPDSVYKALYFGLPIITTNTGIAYEFLRHRACGLIIDRDYNSSWLIALQQVIDKKLIIKTPKKNEVVDFFDWKKISNYYFKTYNDILKDFYG